MKIASAVNNFFMKLYANPNVPTGLKALIDNDIKAFDESITEKILSRRMKLEWGWNSYVLSNVDIFYDDLSLQLSERLELFGVRDDSPVIRPGDSGLTIIYRFTVVDIMGTEMDMVTGIRVTVMRPNNVTNTQRIVVYG